MEERLKKFDPDSHGPSMEFFKLRFESVKGDKIIFSCEFKDECGNPMGFVQGGMISAALDDATSVAMICAYEEKKAPMTTDLHVLFHRPLPLGKANMEVNIIKLGARSATSEGRIFNQEGKLAATLLHTAQPVDVQNN
tara:strand:- start:49 stop:462 length:414 start_codon:yes stop_codon:yes gene_type:complete